MDEATDNLSSPHQLQQINLLEKSGDDAVQGSLNYTNKLGQVEKEEPKHGSLGNENEQILGSFEDIKISALRSKYSLTHIPKPSSVKFVTAILEEPDKCDISTPRRHRTVTESSNISISSIDSSSVQFTKKAPDGGYGWVIVICSLVVNLIADGITFSFGVLYVEFLSYFKESKAKTAWIGSFFMAMPLLSGPIASTLVDHYGCRKMTILGSILSAMGFCISAFCDNIELLFLTFGIFSGFGLSLCYVAAIVIVAYYFEKRRSFATGLAVCGSGIGTFIFAPFTQFLLDFYGWRGTVIILAGCFLNMCICGALMRDLEWCKKKFKSEKSLKTCSEESLPNKSELSATEIEALKLFLMQGSPLGSAESDDKVYDRLCNSLIQLPTFLKDKENLPKEVLELLYNNPAMCQAALDSNPNLLLSNHQGCLDGRCDNDKRFSYDHSYNATSLLNDHGSSSQSKKRAIKFGLLKSPENLFSPDSKFSAGSIKNINKPRHSLTYRGAMLNINRYKFRSSSCPDIYQTTIGSLPPKSPSELVGILRDFKKAISEMLDLSYFLNVKYLLFALSNFLLYAFYDVPYVYLADYAISIGYKEEDASFLISIIGILNTIGEVFLGYLGDKSWVNPVLMYSLCMMVCGFSTLVIPFLREYYALGSATGLFGGVIAANYSLTSVILVNLISLEKFPSAYGLLLLVQGVGNLIGPPLAGLLCDLTNSFNLAFIMAGIIIIACGVILLVLPCHTGCRNWRNIRGQNKSNNMEMDKTVFRKGECHGYSIVSPVAL